MHSITVRRFFDAAHQLPDTNDLITKQCARLHGHTYLAEVSFKGEIGSSGMLVDFKKVKDCIDILDHQFINDIFCRYNFGHDYIDMKDRDPLDDPLDMFRGFPSTAENIARFLYEIIMKEIPLARELCIKICEGYKGNDSISWITYEG